MAIVADAEKPDILICHVSDLHIRGQDSIALERLQELSGAIGSLIIRPTNVILVISGDLAFSGSAEEYALATVALKRLLASLRSWNVVDSYLVVSPGNHDCDFTAMPAVVQSALIKDIPIAGCVDSIARELARMQAEFNLFRDVVCAPGARTGELLSHVRLDLQARILSFYLINTAWTSKKPETPGLRMPKDCLPDPVDDSDLSVAVAHHPLNWYAPQDARYFSDWLDTHVDMAFWGHEHEIDEFEQTRTRLGSKVKHLIAMPIQDAISDCGFSCVKIDSITARMEKTTFQWSDGNLGVLDESRVDDCPLNPARFLGKNRFTNAHADFLDVPGMLLKHPQLTRHLRLSEILVLPEFRALDSSKVEVERMTTNLGVAELVQASLEAKKTIVFGPEQAGKTTLAKILISEMRRRGLVPLYLDASSLSSANRGEIKAWVNSSLASQYEADSLSEIAKLEPSGRFIVLDNLQSAPAGSTGISRVFEFASAWAGNILSLTSDSQAISVLSAEYETEVDSAYWIGSVYYELLPLSHKLRGEMIRKWVSIGRTDILSMDSIEHEARQVKGVIDIWLGKNFLPRFPVFVLVLLQQMDVGRELKTAISNGSQGFLFEALITKALEGFVHQHPINTVRDFLSELAGQLWMRDVPHLEGHLVDELHANFTSRLVTIRLQILLEELASARLIASDARGVSFRYPYLFYYFLALWVSRQSDDIRKVEILRLAEFIHTERSANVLIFLSHFEKEREVLAVLLPLANQLYEHALVGTLNEHSKLSVRYRTAEDRDVLLIGKPDQVTDHVHSERDSIDQAMLKREDEELKTQLDDSFKLNTATKTVQVLGQVLKSRASGLSAEEKIEIAKTAMGLTRRMLSFFYQVLHDNADTFVLHASDAFEKAFKVNKPDAIKIANDFIGMLVVGFGRYSIAKIAEALASPELPLLLSRLEGASVDEDSRLMLLTARVIGDSEYPSQAVTEFNSSLKPANVLSHSILSWAVARRFHMDPPDHAMRDQACALLGIETKRLPARIPSGFGSQRR